MKFNFGLKPWPAWCWFYYCNEAGLAVIQLGPFILELWKE